MEQDPRKVVMNTPKYASSNKKQEAVWKELCHIYKGVNTHKNAAADLGCHC
ncbi:hypothetical protein LEMLEM_LOCUS25823 [Lemmus lemmus]